MIDPKFRDASEKTSELLYNALYLVTGAWQLANELTGPDPHSNALAGLLTMAEDILDNAIDNHNAEWEIVKDHTLAKEASA